MGFGKKDQPGKEKLSALQLTKMLGELFVKRRGSSEAINKVGNQFSIKATETETYLCLASLYLVSFLNALQADEIQLNQGLAKRIAQTLADSLVAQQSDLAQPSEPKGLYQKLKEMTDGLLKIWDDHVDETPSPQWYVGKEACYLLNGRDKMPNPALVMMFSSMISDDTTAIKALIQEAEGKYILVK